MGDVHIKFPTLHSAQLEFYRGIGRRTVGRCGRRFGKTTMLEVACSDWALAGLKIGWFAPLYKFLTPTYDRVYRYLSPVIERKNKSEMLLTLESMEDQAYGGSLEFWTLDNPDAGRSRDYDVVVVDEAGLQAKGLRDIIEQAIEPTLLDRDGKIIMVGTPKGIDPENFFYVACTDKSLGWTEFHYPTHSNPTLSQEAVARLKAEKPPKVYRQEHLAEFVDWSGEAFFSLDKLLKDGHPVQYPHANAVFAVLDTAIKTGKENDGTAVSYYAMPAIPGEPLVILDYDKVQVEGSLLETWLPQVYTRLEELSRMCKSRMGSLGAFIEDKGSGTILLQQAIRRNWSATPIDGALTAMGKDERAISVSGYVWQDRVKISGYAYDKVITFKGVSRNHFVSEICGFRVGVKDQEDDLLDTFCYALSIALGNAEGF